MLKVHHLNCATACPVAGQFVPGGFKKIICHCLLLETDQGLVLVDSGLGLKDIARDKGRLPEVFVKMAGLVLDESETAIRQVKKLGFKASDVKHILLTHLDLDHAGGLSDFPKAIVHVYRPEYEAANRFFKGPIASFRYRPAQWSHNPEWRIYKTHGEKWNGFDAVHDLKGLSDDILMIPLIGHTHGHCGIAVKTKTGWLLHAGDAYFHHGEIDTDKAHCPSFINVFEKIMEVDGQKRVENQRRLIDLKVREKNIRIFCAHDPEEGAAFGLENS